MDRRLVEPSELPTTGSLAPEYYAVLSSVIESSQDNPAQLRNLVYELARINLRREIFVRHPMIRKVDVEKRMRELEEAIEHVENTSDDDSLMLMRRPLLLDGTSGNADRASGLAIPDRETLMAQFRATTHEPPIEARESLRTDRTVWLGVRSALRLIGASIVGILVFAALTGQLEVGRLRTAVQEPALPESVITARLPAVPPAASASADTAAPSATVGDLGVPLPTSYGVYAVNDGQLIELERLQMRVPDARVFISPDIKEPSLLTLSDGKVMFVVFRRDWAGAVPEKVAVRVVAQVAREMTFKDGKAQIKAVANMWRIRSNSYEFRIAPAGDNPEMVVARADDGVLLPPGRYALVLNGLGYDFTVAGTITDPVQCLERTEAVGGQIYSECRQ